MFTSALVIGLAAVITGLWSTIQQFADIVLLICLLLLLVWFLRIVALFVIRRW